MPPLIATAGSQAIASGVAETTLAVATDPGVYEFALNCPSMANGDIIEARLYSMPPNAATYAVAYFSPYAHIQSDPNKYSVPVPVPTGATGGIKVTLKGIAGATHTYPWSLLRQP